MRQFIFSEVYPGDRCPVFSWIHLGLDSLWDFQGVINILPIDSDLVCEVTRRICVWTSSFHRKRIRLHVFLDFRVQLSPIAHPFLWHESGDWSVAINTVNNFLLPPFEMRSNTETKEWNWLSKFSFSAVVIHCYIKANLFQACRCFNTWNPESKVTNV